MIWKKKKTEAVCPEFENIMRRAKTLEDNGNILGLEDLLKTIWRRLQSELLLTPFLANDHASGSFDRFDFSFQPEARYGSFWDYLIEDKIVSLDLSTDIVLPNPWHPQRITQNLGTIGSRYPKGIFKQTSNHFVSYCWPLLVGVVGGGNHSIAQAIIRGEGELVSEEFIDLSPLVEAVGFDGVSWRDLKSGEEIAAPSRRSELGWAWEVGRILMKYKTIK